MRHDSHYVDALTRTNRALGRVLPIEQVVPNPAQPRVEFGDLTDLTASIAEKGILEPLLVKPVSEREWLIIAGERRWRAAQLAGLTEVPCIELDIAEAEIAEIALIENLQRKDLTVWEEADGLAALGRQYGYTHDDIAKKIGKSRSTVTESLTIAALPANVRAECRAAEINSKSAILSVARQFDEPAMLDFVARLKSNSNANENDANENETSELIEADDDRSTKPPNRVAEVAGLQTKIVNSPASQSAHSYPARMYSFQPADGNFRIALKFKKPAEKAEIIVALKEILRELEEVE